MKTETMPIQSFRLTLTLCLPNKKQEYTAYPAMKGYCLQKQHCLTFLHIIQVESLPIQPPVARTQISQKA